MAKSIRILLVFLLLLLMGEYDAHAQCAMCKAVAESATTDNTNIGAGINKGIIYIMLIPYLCLSFLGLYFFGPKKVKIFIKNLVTTS